MPAPLPDDATPALLRAVRAGDTASLDRLLRTHQAALLDRIRGMMGDRARDFLESGDVLQDTFVDIARGIAALGSDDEDGFLRWAASIAQNNLRDQLRRRRLALLDTLSGCLDTNTPSRDASRRDLDEIVRRAIESLPADHAQVIGLRDVQQLSFDAIAERMGRTPNAVQILHTRAMTRLGQKLRKALDEA